MFLLSTGCHTGSFRNYSNAASEEYYDTTVAPPYVSKQDAAIQPDNCTRGTPTPVVKKSVYSNARFILKKDSLTGIETVSLKNNDRLTITNTGCEYYTLIFRFETSAFSQDSVSKAYWFKAGSMLMKSILKGLDAPINLKKGIDKLDHIIKKDSVTHYQNLSYEKEIDFGAGDIRSIIVVEPVQWLDNGISAVTISFSVGPL
ncbi:hypothetical protein A8C56_12985 [Niabella ginsenosidivorans]|uniref:Uncharacterized protein n=2 Tax=Niabella ginsenosidivorans TaxID=1176587 RepID=A0A1A9I2D1_9BACT|nr:hypothetical protein A8C56_12985 [Niabella ginsenosidivorans]